MTPKTNSVSTMPVNLDRLIRRNQLAILFWREKVIELVGNYRSWKSTIDALDSVDAKYKIVQTRRVKRLVAQSYVEYRRKQAELKMLIDIQQSRKAGCSEIDAELECHFMNHAPLPLQPIKARKRKSA